MTKLVKDATLHVQGKDARIVDLIDELGEKTEEVEEACWVLYQFEEDRQPAGTKQPYQLSRIVKGSLAEMALN